ncbi:MAG: pyruvate kinase [Patescibacteria group bacterium]
MHKKVKIVATLGPASDSPEMILKLAKLGVDVFRFNLTHATLEESHARTKAVRKAEETLARPLAIVGDLGGPKIRTGMTAERQVHAGDVIRFVKSEDGTDALTINFPEIIDHLAVGAEIYLNDGAPKLEVTRIQKGVVTARVVVPGVIKSKMGFSAQGMHVNAFTLSAKDKADIKMMAEVGADALAISFVQSVADVRAVRKACPKGYAPMLIAKIETKAGVDHAEEILREADGLMVARGDLGFAVPLAEVPHIQKQLIRIARMMGKPVITATQMLESMTANHLPTRAEVTDVANAILDGTDAVMLSGETARGAYPEEVIRTMVRIITRAQVDVVPQAFPDNTFVADAVAASAVRIADQLNAHAIISFTETGRTAQRIARYRHSQFIVALTPSASIARRLNFSWGVSGVVAGKIASFDAALPEARSHAKTLVKKGGQYVVVAGRDQFGTTGTTNLVLVQTL